MYCLVSYVGSDFSHNNRLNNTITQEPRMVPGEPLSSPVWQIYASVTARLASVLNQSRCVVCYHAYAHLLILSFSPRTWGAAATGGH